MKELIKEVDGISFITVAMARRLGPKPLCRHKWPDYSDCYRACTFVTSTQQDESAVWFLWLDYNQVELQSTYDTPCGCYIMKNAITRCSSIKEQKKLIKQLPIHYVSIIFSLKNTDCEKTICNRNISAFSITRHQPSVLQFTVISITENNEWKTQHYLSKIFSIRFN